MSRHGPQPSHGSPYRLGLASLGLRPTLYDGLVPLRLLVGPANAGKVSRLLDRYVQALDREPCFVVPNRHEIELTERELLERQPALLGGWIGTFDDLFRLIAPQNGQAELITSSARRLVLQDVAATEQLARLGRSARFDGFVDTLAETIDELEAALLEPGELAGELAALHEAYRARLDALGLTDRQRCQRAAIDRLLSERDAWSERPVLAYGFTDLTGAQWALIEALSARTDVTVSLPYEPGRRAFGSVHRTAEDLARLAGEAIEELQPAEWGQAPALAHLERMLFELPSHDPPPIGGAIRFLEAAGTRGVLELVADEIATLLHEGVPADEIGVVCPDLERLRRPLEVAFEAHGVPFALDGNVRLSAVPFGRALLRLARFAWLEGSRADLFAFLRSRFSDVPRSRVDYVEGRLRGRSIIEPARVEAEAVELFEHGLEAVELLRGHDDPSEALRELVAAMMRHAWTLSRPQAGEEVERDLTAHDTVLGVLDDLSGWRDRSGRLRRDELVACLEHERLRPRRDRPGRVVVTDLLRVRTRRLEAVFVLRLEEGALPRPAVESPFLGDEERRELDAAVPARRLTRANSLARDRYLFYSACTRARTVLALARESGADDGRVVGASPFWDEVRMLFDPEEVERATRRRTGAWPPQDVESAPTERERLRALAALGATEPAAARSVAAANGLTRRIERALTAFSRPTALTRAARAELEAASTFSVTDLEQFGTCSSLWFVDRQLKPREIDRRVDPRLRGTVAHRALHRFYAGIPRSLGVEQVSEDRLEEALAFLRECLAEAIESQVWLELTEVELLELEGSLGLDLERFLRREVELGLPLVPRRLEVAFGNERAAAELQRGLDLGGFSVSGKIDRIDLDPFSARGIVQDYKSGEAFSAAKIEQNGLLQIPLYALALRDLVGIEPVGGLYRSLSGKRGDQRREERGMLRADARDELIPGLAANDYLSEDDFLGIVELAKEHAREAVGRIREGDVQHDPRGGQCPSWCDRWPMCRVRRA